MKKIATIDLQGKEYATVPTRIKEFRKDCPFGDIKTEYKIEGDQIVFTAYILKNKNDINSASSNGHAIGKLVGLKAFEKLETISIGRALAILGYMASGEIASGEEMEAFYSYQNEMKEEMIKGAIIDLEDCKTLVQLQEKWATLGRATIEPEVLAKKDALKAILK